MISAGSGLQRIRAQSETCESQTKTLLGLGTTLIGLHIHCVPAGEMPESLYQYMVIGYISSTSKSHCLPCALLTVLLVECGA